MYIIIVGMIKLFSASKPHGQCKLVHECTPVMGLFAECKENICVCKYNYYLGQDNKCAKVKGTNT